jgi:hypothetical protein
MESVFFCLSVCMSCLMAHLKCFSNIWYGSSTLNLSEVIYVFMFVWPPSFDKIQSKVTVCERKEYILKKWYLIRKIPWKYHSNPNVTTTAQNCPYSKLPKCRQFTYTNKSFIYSLALGELSPISYWFSDQRLPGVYGLTGIPCSDHRR